MKKMIFLSDLCRRTGVIDICVPRAAVLASLGALGLTAVGAWGGFQFGEHYGQRASVDVATAEVQLLLDDERRAIADAKAEQHAHLDAMALRIAELQAHLMRLDALGGRLVEVGKLDSEEFDFANAPPVGGVEDLIASDSQSLPDLSAEMQRLASVLEDREDKLRALEQLLMNRELRAEVLPSGWPVKKGWMSSGFGKRTDPFNGKKSYHRGVDFAGKRGSDVVAVASGVVVRAESATGFGNLVEIRHADGFSTLYGHNKQNLVKVGDVVSKGDTVALLGSTGRSSGPHVHFEVHRDGRAVNPAKFVSTN